MKFISLRFVATFLLSVALVAPGMAQDGFPRPRLISVTGTAEVTVPPDAAILSIAPRIP